MKYSKIFFSLYPVLSLAQDDLSPGHGYLDTPDVGFTQYIEDNNSDSNAMWESAVPISAEPPGLIQSGEYLTAMNEDSMTNAEKRRNKKDDDEDDDEDIDLSPSPTVTDMSADEAQALAEMASEEIEKSKEDAQNDGQLRVLETAQSQLKALGLESMTAQAADSILANGGPFRGSSGHCRSASTGKKSKKNGGCEAVLPLNLNYGCWCHADNADIFKGKGQPVDEFDKACKMYKQCLRCVRLDSRNDGLVCDPGSQNYTTENHRSKDGIHTECSRNNDGDCAINTCCCEVDYVRTILKLFMIDGVRLNKSHYHHRFDHDAKCQGVGSGGHEVDCCGPYPKRRMYNTHSRQCCYNQAVYDPYTHVCCEDGQPARTADECDNPNRNQKRKKRAIERENFMARVR